MTGVRARPAVGPAAEGAGTRRAWPLLVAAALVVGVVAAVLLFGVQRPPPLSSLAEAPDPAPSARVAWMDWTGSEACLHVAGTDGTVEQPWCSRAGGELLAWPDADRIELLSYDGRESVRTIDPTTGAVVDREPLRSGARLPEPEAAVWHEHRDGALTVTLADEGSELWRVAATERYGITTSARSPDGDWVVMVDSAGRLLLAPADGRTAPRVWATDAPTWSTVVWEGSARG